MKKSLLAVGVLSAFAGAASAQSSVTLSGAVDVGVQYRGGEYTMGTAGSSRSNIKFSGIEDLGGGLKAFFLLEHRFEPTEGNTNVGTNIGNPDSLGGVPFWRNSWVGLSSNFGDIRLGRILMPLQDVNGKYEAWDGGDTLGNVHTGGIRATNRANNAIYYRTPSWGGLVLHAAIAAGDNQVYTGDPAVDAGSERPMGFAAKFDAGGFSVAAAYDQNAIDQTTYGLYGKWNLGAFTLFGQYESGDQVGGEEVDRYSISGTWAMGAAVLKAGYTDYTDEDSSKFGLGLDYNLSKRTTLYTNIGKISTDAAALTEEQRDDAEKTMFDIGIWHKF